MCALIVVPNFRAHQKTKLYCYVDESGQDTEGRLFIVVAVIDLGERREIVYDTLQQIERNSGKGQKKWSKTTQIRIDKVRGVVDEADPLIRLADAMAGCVRSYLEDDSQFVRFYEMNEQHAEDCSGEPTHNKKPWLGGAA